LYVHFRTHLGNAGLKLNARKSEVYPAQVWDIVDPPTMRDDGIKVLGAWISRDEACTKAWLHKQLRKHDEGFKRLQALAVDSPREALRILSVCMVPRMTYLLRTHPPSTTRELCVEFDRAVDEVLTTIFGEALTPTSRSIISLPLRDGGLGVPITELLRECAYAASVDPEGAPSQRTAAALQATALKEELCTDPRIRAILASQAKKHTAQWLSPLAHLTPEAARTALKLRGVVDGKACTCGCGLAFEGGQFEDHVLGCARNEEVTVATRHNLVRDAIAQIARKAKITTRTEPRFGNTKRDDKGNLVKDHPDLTLYLPDGPLTLDIHVNSGVVKTNASKADPTAATARKKKAKYTEMVESAGHRFAPCGFQVSGAFSANALAIAKELVEASGGGLAWGNVVADIAVAIQLGNHEIIMATRRRDAHKY
jgi:hypothetical protein